jgi:DNA invertase Pin-like site-specific DNA recombinase
MLGAFAEFELSLRRERQREGIAIAKREGKYKGRKRALGDKQLAEMFALLETGVPKAKLGRKYDITTMTIRNYLRERVERAAATSKAHAEAIVQTVSEMSAAAAPKRRAAPTKD